MVSGRHIIKKRKQQAGPLCFIVVLTICYLFGTTYSSLGQSKAALKQVQRYEIDAKRSGENMFSDDALPRAREFKRIDSSYYVGWLFEGVYKYNHAADYIGFKNAIPALEKALFLLERDYARELKIRSSDFQVYVPVYSYHNDHHIISYALKECYANTEQPEQVYRLMRRILSWKFQKTGSVEAYTTLSWITHRYRFYTHKQYSFLQNSIDENETLAGLYLDSALRDIQINKKYNDNLFRPGHELSDKLNVYHYKCILYSYNFQIDSAEKYYKILERKGGLSNNNYANFKLNIGQFRAAEAEYEIASTIESGDKRLQEWAYYTSILDICKGKPAQSIALSQGMIKAFGSMPGFGWYQIALSRAYAYNGQLDAAAKALDKASKFKELHIGTTLGQSHYDFSIQLQKLIQLEQQIAIQKFENKNWWYSPSSLSSIAQLSTERLMFQYFVVNQFAQNPERDRVVYKLFSTESTVCWDEVYFLIKDFSTSFFIKKFEKELSTDKRQPILKYFRLFIARLKIKQGKAKEARVLLYEILQDKTLDPDYEKLLLARTYESLAEIADEESNSRERNKWMLQAMRTFPQTIPFCNTACPVRIQSTTPEHPVLRSLRNYNFDFRESENKSAHVNIRFFTKEGRKFIALQVNDAQKKSIIPEQQFTYTDNTKAARELAYRIFGIMDTGSGITDSNKKK